MWSGLDELAGASGLGTVPPAPRTTVELRRHLGLRRPSQVLVRERMRPTAETLSFKKKATPHFFFCVNMVLQVLLN